MVIAITVAFPPLCAPIRANAWWLQTARWLLPVLLAVFCSPALAQGDVATVRIDGRGVFQVGPGAEDGDPAARARRVEERLSPLLGNPDALAPAAPRRTTAGWSVTVSGIPVVSVTPRDAEDAFTTEADLARQWAAALDTALQSARERRLGWGGRFVTETRGSGEAAIGRLAESVSRIIPRVLAAAIVIALFWLLARGVRGLLRLIFRRTVEDVTVESLVKQLTYYAIITLGFFVAVDALGFDPTTVAAGLGLSGIVLGFALKDILSNFVSGLLLLTLRPFRIGDQIVVGDLEGSVEKIELRATRLRAYDGRVMLVPNAEVFTSRIVNNTADPLRRGAVALWLGYDVDVDRALDVIRNAALRATGVLESPPPAVRIDDLGQDDIRVEVTFWADSQRSDYKNTAAAVRAAILDNLVASGISLPDPSTRTVTVKDTSPDK
ncbi:mechanosensitive ion channel family protein [Sphingomonas suaedae]|uniref:mechanosensitive ion channel family protein n=1 Tax=Sphingomonas suaedae TaxID=2599297 RepID=UPI001644085C|nr:mechanosensitive ion channel family protein [Sphingomonas suaedae]